MDNNMVHVGYECISCKKNEFIAVDPQDVVYADDGMQALGWTKDQNNNWHCPKCSKGGK